MILTFSSHGGHVQEASGRGALTAERVRKEAPMESRRGLRWNEIALIADVLGFRDADDLARFAKEQAAKDRSVKVAMGRRAV